MIFAEQINIPAGFDNWLENLLCLVAIAVLLIAGVRMLLPRPPMDEQLRGLQKGLMERLDQQDADADKKFDGLRGHIDSEVSRIHIRVDSHGQELFRLKGYVEGWKAHP